MLGPAGRGRRRRVRSTSCWSPATCTTAPCRRPTPRPCSTGSLRRLRRAGATVVMTPGNHDSARRLGTFSGLLAAGGLHVRAETARLDEPVLLADEHGEVAIYGLPYLEPEVARHELGLPAARSHEAVLAEAMDRVRADLSCAPARARSCWRTPSSPAAQPERQRARHQRRRCRPGAGGGVRRRRLRRARPPAPAADADARGCATAARRWPTPSPRPGSTKQAWLVDLDAAGLADGRARCRCRRPAPLRDARPAPSRSCSTDPAHAAPRSSSSPHGSPTRSARPTRCAGCRQRFPHCVHLEWAGRAAPTDAPQLRASGCAGAATSRSSAEFVAHGPRRAGHRRASATLLGRALAAAARAEAARMRLHSLSLTAFGPFAGAGRGRLRRGRPRRAVPAAGARPARARRRCSTPSSSRSTAPSRASAARRSGCAATTPAPATRTEVSCEVTLGARAAAGHPPPRAAAAQEARRGLDHRAGQADRASAGRAATGRR